MTAEAASQTPCPIPCPGRPRGFDADQALAAALELFRQQGFEATSIEALTRVMGIGRSSLYACFGSKHGVLLAAIERYSEAALAALAARLEPGTTPEAAALALLAGLAGDGPYGCLMVNCITELAPHDPEVAARGRRHLEAVEALLARALAPRDPSGARDRARALTALGLGTLTLRKAGMAPEPVAAALAQGASLLSPGN